MTEKNLLLPNLDQMAINAGIVHTLNYQSVAIRRFNGLYKNSNKSFHFANKMYIRFDEWQEEMNQLIVRNPQTKTQMTHADLQTGDSKEQIVPLTQHGCVSQLISVDMMKRAMGSVEEMATFVADMMELAIKRGAYEIDKKFLKDICDFSNYKNGDTPKNSPSIFFFPEEFYKADTDDTKEMNKMRGLLSSVNTHSIYMTKEPSRNFNKLGIRSMSFNTRNMGAIISFELKARLKDHYGNTYNEFYVNLENDFAWVEEMPIRQFGVDIIIMDEYGYILDIDDESATGFDDSRKLFRETWFYKWIDAYQQVAHGKNIACWAIDYSFASISNDFNDVLQKEWEDLGFSYAETKKWIDAGLTPRDAKFASWLVKDKVQTEPKASDPAYVTENMDDLMTEFNAL